MVTVPTYARSVQDRPAFQQGITASASGEDLGAGIGRGVQAVAGGLSQAALANQAVVDLEDTTRAKEADNALAEWSRNALYGEGGYMTLSGSGAVDGRAAFEKSWEDQRKKLGAGLSPGAARVYQSASVARRNSVFESAIVHQANERKVWVAEASTARVETFGQDAVANFTDPKKVDFNIASGQAELRQQAQLEGWDRATLAKKEMDYISNVRQSIVMRMALSDPLAAKAYSERFSNQLTGTAQAAIAASLDVSVKDEQSKAEAARIMGIEPLADNSPDGRDEANAAPAGTVKEQLDAIKDDDVRELTRARIKAAQTLQNSANEAAQKQAKTAAYEFIEKGGSPDTLPLEVKSAIGVEGMTSLWSYFDKKAGGDHTVSDVELVYGLNKRAAFDPAGFSKVNLIEYRDRLSPSDFKSLMDLQTKAIGDVGAAGAAAAPMKSAYTQAEASLESVGITLTDLSGADREKEAKRIATFQGVLTTRISEFKDEKDRNPNEAEIQSMINVLLLPVVLKKPAAWNPWSFFWDGGVDTRSGFVFEAGNRADNETADVAVSYLDIPVDLRDAISADLEASLDRKPSPDEVTTRYEEFLLNR